MLQAAPGGQAPRTVRLFINSPDISFVDVEDLQAVQTLELSDAHARGVPIQLQFVKFQNGATRRPCRLPERLPLKGDNMIYALEI